MDVTTKERKLNGFNSHSGVFMEHSEKKIAEKACAIYAQLGEKAREAFVNQLEGMAFVLDSQRREKKSETDKEAS